MDKVQIYYMCLIAFGFIGMLVMVTTETDSPSTASNKMPLKWVTAAILGLPIAGRVFNWW
jgi:hypothetical protein